MSPARARFVVLSTFFVSIFLTGCEITPSTQTSGRVVVESDHARVEVSFNERDRQRIHGYYSQHKKKGKSKGMPPGLAKKDRLPPGLEKQVQRNGTLPPGLEAKRLPGDLERDLSPLPGGYVRVRVGADIVLMDERTRVVFDVIYDVAV
ncbi:MAG: hypothetical protein JSW10_11890 [Pseudomonadota bacterium]|nr:MAG: hypothetical protein JSW10_11890 [Pseudomonadota bacterium]